MNQPTPDVAAHDVERVVRRDYPQESFESIMALLNQYGTIDWQREPDRVRLAALKNAGGSLTILTQQIELSQHDYRDVLAPAEYPGYTKKMFHIEKLSEADRKNIVDNDWKQYEEWLNRK